MGELDKVPVVMAITGVDPTGGAGLQADIETLASMGCHAAPVVSTVTAQDTTDVKALLAIEPELIMQQARVVLEDMPVHAFKLGLLGSVEAVEVVHTLLTDYPDIPVILDPVFAAGGGAELGDEYTIEATISLLLPLTTIATPNSHEARKLAPESDTLDACAMAILERGTEFVLITGTHEKTPQVCNTLYSNHRRLETFRWERLPESYHGSGCTLAAAIAGLLAQGEEPLTAVHEAQEYTWQALRTGYRIGMGQRLPNRLFWASEQDDDADDAG